MIFNQISSGGGGVTPRIPDIYQETLWISGTGTQYIDTGVQASSNIRIDIDFAVINTPKTLKIFGIYEASYCTDVFDTDNYLFRMTPYGDAWGSGWKSSDNQFHSVVWRDEIGRYLFDGDVIKRKTNTWSSEKTYYLFDSNGDSIPAQIKLRSCIFRRNSDGVILRNFIPCYRKSDLVAGLYDLVSQTFSVSIGADNFISGPIAIPVSPLTVNANGTYTPSGSIMGYSPVNVNVPNPSSGVLNIIANGTYNVTSKAMAVVDVSGQQVISSFIEPKFVSRATAPESIKRVSLRGNALWRIENNKCYFYNFSSSYNDRVLLYKNDSEVDIDWSKPFKIVIPFFVTDYASHGQAIIGCSYGYSCYSKTPTVEINTGGAIWAGFSTSGDGWEYQLNVGQADSIEKNVWLKLIYEWTGTVWTVSVTKNGTTVISNSAEVTASHYYGSSYHISLGGNANLYSCTADNCTFALEGAYISSEGVVQWGDDSE